MRSETTVRHLERRVAALEHEVASLKRSPEAERARARELLIAHLRAHEDVEPLKFAVDHELPTDVVESVLQEFDRKKWTVPVDD